MITKMSFVIRLLKNTDTDPKKSVHVGRSEKQMGLDETDKNG